MTSSLIIRFMGRFSPVRNEKKSRRAIGIGVGLMLCLELLFFGGWRYIVPPSWIAVDGARPAFPTAIVRD